MNDFPILCIEWIVYNASSNVELSTFSNVSRCWREVVVCCIVDSVVQEPPTSVFRCLLLPSMIRYYHYCYYQNCSRSHLSQHQQRQRQQQQQYHQQRQVKEETYCISWFHPDGIKSKQLPLLLNTSLEDDNINDKTKNEKVLDLGERNQENEQQKAIIDPQTTTTTKAAPPLSPSYASSYYAGDHRKEVTDVSCVYQWNSYSNAIDVLKPFGYALSLVQKIMKRIQCQFRNTANVNSRCTNVERKDHNTDIPLPSSTYDPPFDFFQLSGTSCSSFAVRGALYARPEGYCQCWDNDHTSIDFLPVNYNISKMKRNRRKRELQREVLPKVLWSKHQHRTTPASNNKAVTYNNDIDCGDVDMTQSCHNNNKSKKIPETDNLPNLQTRGILRPCIQFLNIDSSHAVRLFTPPFDKVESTPLTIFCVAIATEDGCFFSGLRRTFEMGHMYPATSDVNEERSPICLNAVYTDEMSDLSKEEFRQKVTASFAHQSQNDQEKNNQRKGGNEEEYDCHQRNSYSTTDIYSGPDYKCFCHLNDAVEDKSFQDVDDTEEDCDNIVRGQLGPGMWHCYVAVFDGEKSVIRVDGVEELLTRDSMISPSSQACLDGITIGSDHNFDMSLCFGLGSDGEGEGAMAELAIFKGHLKSIDILALEMHLMTKHGIPFPVKPKNERNIDDFYSRRAHTLMDQIPSCVSRSHINDNNIINRGVPLRYMTLLREVAWKQTNQVTGRQISVQRIGNKFRNGSSSEW